MNDVFSIYATTAQKHVTRFEAIPSEDLLAHVADLLPPAPARVADIGAGSGRDAAWFAARGYDVLAVEPVAELRTAAMALHPSPRIAWLDDRLPHLPALAECGQFDLVTLCAVWHHLAPAHRETAMTRLAATIAPGGLLILSLRHGPEYHDRPVYPVRPEETVEEAGRCGLALVRRVEADSIQGDNRAAEVRWTWLALRKG